MTLPSPPPAPPGVDEPIRQVAVAVRDLDAAMRAYWQTLAVGPWTVYTLSPPRLRDPVFRGRRVEFGFRHALAWSGEVQLELIQPLHGPNLYSEHLERHGEGLQHLGIYTADIAAAGRRLESRGLRPVQSAHGFGARGDGAFAYYESDLPLAVCVELIQAPSERIDPDLVYPADAG